MNKEVSKIKIMGKKVIVNKKIKGAIMEWKHPSYYAELRRLRKIEEEKESENNEDTDPSEQSQDPQSEK